MSSLSVLVSGGGRRDSGYSPAKDEAGGLSPLLKVDGQDSMEVETRDSGVGSPSPHPAARSWGRKRSRRSEIKRLKEIQAALEDLASIHGGEVHFTYTPRTHPNLPKLYPHQAHLMIPRKEVDRADDSSRVSIQPGYFLSRTGLSTTDIAEKRLPDMPSGGLAVVSNGLAIDLFRICNSDPGLGSSVVKYIFHFLELRFPDSLVDKAVEMTLEYIGENLEYVVSCKSKRESENFLFSPFVLPDGVTEMASLLEDEEDNEELYVELAVPEPINHGPLVTENNVVNIVNNGLVETFEISSIEDLVADTGEDSNLLQHTSWATVPQEDYSIVHSEDENFSVTATVLTIESEHADLVATLDVQPQQHGVPVVSQPQQHGVLVVSQPQQHGVLVVSQPQQHGVPVDSEVPDLEYYKDYPKMDEKGDEPQSEVLNNLCSETRCKDAQEKAPIKGGRMRSRTREVQIPARFKDFDTESPNKRLKY